jgi:hypothetical protein
MACGFGSLGVGDRPNLSVRERRKLGYVDNRGRNMIRILSIFTTAVLCVSCRTESSPAPNQAEPLIDAAEINARDDCLRREMVRLLEPHGSAPNTLQEITVSATSYCSQAIKARLLRASPTVRDGQELAKDDQIKTEQRAFAFGLELRESRAR